MKMRTLSKKCNKYKSYSWMCSHHRDQIYRWRLCKQCCHGDSCSFILSCLLCVLLLWPSPVTSDSCQASPAHCLLPLITWLSPDCLAAAHHLIINCCCLSGVAVISCVFSDGLLPASWVICCTNGEPIADYKPGAAHWSQCLHDLHMQETLGGEVRLLCNGFISVLW